MADIFDNKTDTRVVKECWNQQTTSRTPLYVRSQSENQGNKALDSLVLPMAMGSESSAQETSSKSRNISAPFLRLVDDLPKLLEETSLKLRKTLSHSDNELRGGRTELGVAINNERNNSALAYKPGLERKGFSNQTIPKGRKSFKRRASLPSNHLGEYLSVNNIRRRAQNGGSANDSDRDVVSLNKVKNANRKKLRLPSTEEPQANENPVEETIVVSPSELDNAPGNDIKDCSNPKIPVRKMFRDLSSSSFRSIVHYEFFLTPSSLKTLLSLMTLL